MNLAWARAVCDLLATFYTAEWQVIYPNIPVYTIMHKANAGKTCSQSVLGCVLSVMTTTRSVYLRSER